MVVEARGLENRVFGQENFWQAALGAGLIDGVGYLDQALQVAELMEVDDLYVVRYEQKRIFGTFLRARVPSLTTNSFLGARFFILETVMMSRLIF